MQAIAASGFVSAGNNLMLFRAPAMVLKSLVGVRSIPTDLTIMDDDREMALECLRTLQHDCEGLGFPVTLAAVNRLIEKLTSRIITTHNEMEIQSWNIQERLLDELNSRLFMAIDSKHVSYYNQPLDEWASVVQSFPSTSMDVEEASKCFALNRYTAVVFHLMRVMEVGLRVLGNTLHDPRIDPKTNPTWDRILQRCRDEQAKPLVQRSQEWRSDEPFFSGVSARLMAVKDAWRNPTMHVERTYTEETALDVFNHVQAFMRHTATKLSESP